jgi:hypothetical protein
MNRRFRAFPSLGWVAAVCLGAALSGATPAFADTSHARVIRLSLVEGDVRFARDLHGKDPLAENHADWETAQQNLPLRQGYVLATDSGRTEVEFENGGMAFLDSNSVVEFYDLSLEEGTRTTRLVLRQGTATFYVNPERGEYFSVTGGDFTVEAAGKCRFRVNNFDDGSNLAVESGRVNLLRKNGGSLMLSKGQSFTMKAGDEESAGTGRLPDDDQFDRWVSGRIDTVQTATNASLQYSGGVYDTGMADLFTYGSWMPVSGYGYGWRPYGVGLGWCPFDNGGWFYDPFFGWGFVGYQPWGWMPYHYGSWLFAPGIGWVWTPAGRTAFWQPATGVFVRGRNGVLGVVPVHPFDAHGKTPVNLNQGVFEVRGAAVGPAMAAGSAHDWKVLKSAPRDAAMSSMVARTTAPERVSRTMISTPAGGRVVTLSKDSSIAYDPKQHKFVSTEAAAKTEHGQAPQPAAIGSPAPAASIEIRGAANSTPGSRGAAPPPSAGAQRTSAPPAARVNTPPSARAGTPPPAPGTARVGGAGSAAPRGGSGGWGGASAPRPNAGARPAPNAGGAKPSGGGRPH